MDKILIISTIGDIDARIGAYINNNLLPEAEYTIVQERYGEEPLKMIYAKHYIPIFDIGDIDEVRRVAKRCKEFGPFDYIVQTDEYSVILSQKIKTLLQTDENTLKDIIRFRDKKLMKDCISNVRVPQMFTVEELSDNPSAFPVIIKPRSFAASEGIYIAKDLEELNNIISNNELKFNNYKDDYDYIEYEEAEADDVEIEEYIEGDTYHIDGYVFKREVEFCVASQYINSCLDFTKGKPLGSVYVLDDKEQEAWTEFAKNIHKDLHIPDGVFHIEGFKTKDAQRVFMEMAIRPGGGLIIEATQAGQGIDLLLAHIQCQLGIKPAAIRKKQYAYGFLLMSNMSLPYDKNLLLNVNMPEKYVSTLVKANICYRGEEISRHNGYRGVYSDFIFQGESVDQIKLDIKYLMENVTAKVQEIS